MPAQRGVSSTCFSSTSTGGGPGTGTSGGVGGTPKGGDGVPGLGGGGQTAGGGGGGFYGGGSGGEQVGVSGTDFQTAGGGGGGGSSLVPSGGTLALDTTGTPQIVIQYVVPNVPGAPTGAAATAGNAQATISFAPPASNRGTPVTGYTVTATDRTTPD
jgi:hypothetical protein